MLTVCDTRTSRARWLRVLVVLTTVGLPHLAPTSSQAQPIPVPPTPIGLPMPPTPLASVKSVPISSLFIDPRVLRDMPIATPFTPLAGFAFDRLASVRILSGEESVIVELARRFRAEAPEPWDAQDPADSLYRVARQALARDAYRDAAELFKQLRQRFPKSSYAPDAPYWEAFALQRLGGTSNLNGALRVLGMQRAEYPKAATRGDAAALRSRVEGVLAGSGNIQLSTTLMGRAQRVTADGCPSASDDERISALTAVTQMDATQALPVLKKVLARREPCTQELRRTAVWLVASRKQADGASILMNVAKTDPDGEVREQAVFWLANVPTDESTAMLVDLARSGDDLELRKRAVYALSRSKSPRAVSTLREIALDANAPDDLRVEVLNWYLASPARATGDDAVAFLQEVYGKANSDLIRQMAVMSIAAQRTEKSRNVLMTLALNERESLDIRQMAVTSLGTPRYSTRGDQAAGTSAADVTSAVTALAKVYDQVSTLEVRRTALMALGGARDNAGLDKLLDIARNEKNAELRRAAVSYLTRSKDPRALALLQEIIDR